MSAAGIVFFVFFVIAGLSVFYLFFFSLMGRFFYRELAERGAGDGPLRRIAGLVPAYKEDGIILSTAKGLLSLGYPEDLYDVDIIADGFQAATVEQLRGTRGKVVDVDFVKSNKA